MRVHVYCTLLQVHESLDEDLVLAARKRLSTAVEAEHAYELYCHATKLGQSREELEASGAMLTGLHLEHQESGR